MSFSKITQVLRRNIFPSHFVNRGVRCLQSLSFMLRNSRPDLFKSSLSGKFTSAESGHKAEAVKQEGSNISEKKLTTSFRELVQKKFIDTSKKLKDPDTPPTRTGKSIWTLIRDNWKQVLGIGILTDVLLALAVNKFSEYRVNSALANGTRPESGLLEDEFVPRPHVSEALAEVFQPNERQSYYYVICGEHGTGKTTLATMEAKNVGEGVIYVDIPSDFRKLGKAFGKAMNLTFFEDFSVTLLLMRKLFAGMGLASETSISIYQWERAMEIFQRASEVYKKRNHKPPIIIYDNISRIVKNSEILDILQDDAKDNADKRLYIAVFVSNEGSVPRRMESRSAWSRAKKPVIEIGDLSKEESMEYLTEKHKINEVDAKRIYELVGGRIVDLKIVADDFAKQTFEVIKQQVFDAIYDNFESAEMNPGQPNHEAAKIIIRALINSDNVLHISKFREMTKVEPSKLLESNVFAYHPKNKTVTFQSRSTECYIRENENFIN